MQKNFSIMAVVTIGFSIYMIVLERWDYVLLLFSILLLYFLLTYIMQWYSTKRILKNSPLVENPVMQHYQFLDTEISIHNVNTFSIPYLEIAKLRKTKEFLIITSKTKKTYIVDLKGFDHANDFGLLDSFLRERYSTIYK